MRQYFLPRPTPLSDDDYLQGALDRPLGWWKTAGLSARSAIEDFSIAGYAAREAQAPDLALQDVTPEGRRGFGRFGQQRQYAPESPDAVAARGDKLFASKEEQDASPFADPEVPWEPGMTEKRLEAIHNQRNLRRIRDFYSAKRPVAAFMGTLAGGLATPENFIPILGETAAAATTARLGNVLGIALTMGADAAANSAIFQLALGPQRKQLGDDVSWQAVMENAAFAAAAGSGLGALFGGLRGFFRDGASPGVIENLRNRTAANQNMNDATTGLALNGKVELGEQAKANIGALQQENVDLPVLLDPEERLFNPDELKVDAQRFQFKEGGDSFGVTERLKGVQTWDPTKSGVSLVWQDKDGNYFVADGHQRVGLAKRLKGEGQNPKIRALVLKEADGITAEQARTYAAAKNIAEGTGSVVDAAKLIRSNNMAQLNLPPSSSLVRDAMGVSKLSDDGFRMVINKKVKERDAAIVGYLVEDQAKHTEILGLLAKLKPESAVEAESIVRDALDAPAIQATMEDLFGTSTQTQILYKERAEVLGAAVNAIRKDRSAFKTLVEEESRIAAAGNKLKTEVNEDRARMDGRILAHLQAQARRRGPISDALAIAAKALAEGKDAKAVTREFLDVVRAEIKKPTVPLDEPPRLEQEQEAVLDARHGVTDKPEFKKWFEGSKVVDDAGNPLVVYHGTGPIAFDEFKLGASNRFDKGFFGADGFYLTPQRYLADSYSKLRGGTAANTMELYASIKNPFWVAGNTIRPDEIVENVQQALELHFRAAAEKSYPGMDPTERFQKHIKPQADAVMRRITGGKTAIEIQDLLFAEEVAARGEEEAVWGSSGGLHDSNILDEFRKNLITEVRKLGYDGIFAGTVWNKTYTHKLPSEIVAFNPTQIKSIQPAAAEKTSPDPAGPPAGLDPETLPGMPDLKAKLESGASIDELAAHPTVQDAVKRMEAIPRTDLQSGYLSQEWKNQREYWFKAVDWTKENPKYEKVRGFDNAIERLYEDALSFSKNGPVRQDREAAIFLGPPAAGKSTHAERYAASHYAAIIDPDEAKAVIPEYQGGIGANAVHEESSVMMDPVLQIMKANGNNIVIPKVGGNPESIARTIADLKAAGYRVSLINVKVSQENAFRRMIGRFTKTGRLIPPEYSKQIGEKPAAVYQQLKGTVDDFAEIDSNGAEGSIPRLTDAGQALAGDRGYEAFDGPGRANYVPMARGLGTREAAPRAKEVNFSPEPAEKPPEALAETYKYVDQNVTPKDPIARMEADAKAEGLDLETGKSDLDPEIDALKAQDALNADELATLAAADETVAAVDGWRDTLEQIRTCVLERGT